MVGRSKHQECKVCNNIFEIPIFCQVLSMAGRNKHQECKVCNDIFEIPIFVLGTFDGW